MASPKKAELMADLAHYKQLAEEGVGPLLKSMRLENGEVNMEIVGPMVEAVSLAFVSQFKGIGAINYVEMSLYDRDEPFQRYTLTVQKVGASSPADLLREAKDRIAYLEQNLPAEIHTKSPE